MVSICAQVGSGRQDKQPREVAGFSCHINVAPLGGHKQLSKEGVTRSVVVFILGFPESGLLY